jgi:hypothetical protein
MLELAFVWIYIANALVLVLHQIDSAYQREWYLFSSFSGKRMKPSAATDEKQIKGYLLFNVVAALVVLYGLSEASKLTSMGIIFSGLLGLIGLATFGIHSMFWSRGEKDFTSFPSKLILWIILPLSLFQLAITYLVLAGGF